MSHPLIITDPRVLSGKPIVKGTRISVAFVLRCLASGMSIEEILEGHPTLSRKGIKAALAFAAEHFDVGRTRPAMDRP